nr:unnamed protein product [Digitaria exilis]
MSRGRSPEPLDFFIWTVQWFGCQNAIACLKGEQEVRRPWWAPSCLSIVFMRVAKRNRQSRVVSLKLEA